MTQIKPDHKAFDEYYRRLDEAMEGQDAAHEGNVRRAFGSLLEETARANSWSLVTEESVRIGGRMIRFDGTLRDQWRLPHGHWEAKDSADDLHTEIRRKRDQGYPFKNIIFEDTREAVLFQDGYEAARADIRSRDALATLLTRFYQYDMPPFQEFDKAVAYFQDEIPNIAKGLNERIKQAHRENKKFQAAYTGFMELCRTALNPNIREDAVDEMLIQHMLTERLIRTVFDVDTFAQRNVIAGEIETVINALTSQYFNRKQFLGALDRFYEVIERAADELASYQDKQTFLNTVYERFFQGYSVRIADTHGIVYTPQEIVDFMCAAVEEVLKDEFDLYLGHPDVKILDPCTGTGNFVINLINRVHPRYLDTFYRECLFANEVMLLPYYIASLNIEHAYYELAGKYEPFEGISFVDTLDMAEGAQMRLAFMTERNTERVERQKNAAITVIIGNPPYNVGQLNENDNNKNREYKVIDRRVRETYSKDSNASLNTKLYDAYVKFFRWATDRLGDRPGIVCYVSNNGFLEGIAFDGFRKHLQQDFDSIYHFDFKGNARTSGERRRREGGNIFSDEIRVGVGITLLARTGKSEKTIHYHSVADYISGAEKKNYLASFEKLSRVPWVNLIPDERFTWLVPNNADEFASFVPMGTEDAKKSKGNQEAQALFRLFSLGVATNRDDWVYDFSQIGLIEKVEHVIKNYNYEVFRYSQQKNIPTDLSEFVNNDPKFIKWTDRLKNALLSRETLQFDTEKVRMSLYRPFTKKYLYFDHLLNQRRYQQHHIFPSTASDSENRSVIVGGYGRKDFAVLISQSTSDLNFYADPAQCFPFYVYDEDGSNRQENITDWVLSQFRAQYGDGGITKWDIFYYVYALLHHPVYRERYADNLKRELPRIPFVPGVESFRVFASVGEKLADLHLRYEQVEPYPLEWVTAADKRIDWRVSKMRLKDGYEVPYHPHPKSLSLRERDLKAVDGDESDGEQDLANLDAGVSDDSALLPLSLRARGLGGEGDEARYRERASEAMVQIARDLRQRQTPAETILWEALRNRRLSGLKFRRQHPIANTTYVADFLCYESKLVIEVDGGIHETQQADDQTRQADIEAAGYRVLRFTNAMVHGQLETVLVAILWGAAGHPHPKSLSLRERDLTTLDAGVSGKGQDLPIDGELANDPALLPLALRERGLGGEGEPSEGETTYKAYRELVYNDTLTLRGIPAEAFAYRLGNRSALEWIVDQYRVKEDKRSGIVSDPNRYSDDEQYIVKLVERVVRVSVETVGLVQQLAAVDLGVG